MGTNALDVSNGLFTVTLDFGSGIFTGADRWLEINVRTNGGGAFTTLSPRQRITTVPYAYEAFSQMYAIDGEEKWLRIMRSIAAAKCRKSRSRCDWS